MNFLDSLENLLVNLLQFKCFNPIYNWFVEIVKYAGNSLIQLYSFYLALSGKKFKSASRKKQTIKLLNEYWKHIFFFKMLSPLLVKLIPLACRIGQINLNMLYDNLNVHKSDLLRNLEKLRSSLVNKKISNSCKKKWKFDLIFVTLEIYPNFAKNFLSI